MFIKILIWMLNKVMNGKNRAMLEPVIKEHYRKIAQDNLKIKTQIVNVKKGKRRYDLMFFETPSGTIRLNLGRNWGASKVVELKDMEAHVVAEAINLAEVS